jgi:hypothetical protein
MENTMPNVINHRATPKLALRPAEAAALLAEKKCILAEHPKRPKKTKPGRGTEKVRRLRFDAAQGRYFRAVLDFSYALAVNNLDADDRFPLGSAHGQLRQITDLAVEAAAAKLLGGRELTVERAARYKAIASFMAAEAAVYGKITDNVV